MKESNYSQLRDITRLLLVIARNLNEDHSLLSTDWTIINEIHTRMNEEE